MRLITRKRKIIIKYTLFHLLHRFICLFVKPQNQVLFNAYFCRKYAENTKFISEEFHNINPNTKIVWFINSKNDTYFPNYVDVIEMSHTNIIKQMIVFSKSKVIISNDHFPCEFYKNKNQFYINTWHGGLGIKRIGFDINTIKTRPYIPYLFKNTSKSVDLFLSNSEHLSRLYKSAFHYNGKIWKCGYPKNDILVNNYNNCEIANRIKSIYNIDLNSKILLYAPTFRPSNNIKEGESINEYYNKIYDIDLKLVKQTLEKVTNQKWVILVRIHHVIKDNIDVYNIFGDDVIDVTNYPDMQELILMLDILISDYSSCMFDAALINKIVFLYANDYCAYINNIGTYFELDDLPFGKSTTNIELIDVINSFDKDKYMKDIEKFKQNNGLYETGHAGKDVANYINDLL